MTDKSQPEGDSGYEAEWALEEDSPQDQDVPADDDQQTAEGSTDPEAAADEAPVETPDESPQSSEESGGEEDIWANATEAQRLAFRRAENERLAAANREKIKADKLAERGRELKALRDKQLELEKAARKPTEFESEHELYAKNVQDMIDARLAERLPPVDSPEEKTPEQVEQETFEVITTAHPDAGEVYNSDGMKLMLADDPVFKHEGKAYLFSEALHSSDPHMAVLALSHYKAQTPAPKKTAPLEDMQAPESTSTKQDMRPAESLSVREQYDREWEVDD